MRGCADAPPLWRARRRDPKFLAIRGKGPDVVTGEDGELYQVMDNTTHKVDHRVRDKSERAYWDPIEKAAAKKAARGPADDAR